MFTAIGKLFEMVSNFLDAGNALARAAKAHAENYEQEATARLTKEDLE